MTIRVRYCECDAMGYLHHSRFPQYMEMGRIELLRSLGISYADVEKAGFFFAVVKLEIRFRAPIRFDDEIELLTREVKRGAVRIDHTYEFLKGGTLCAEATTTIACVDREGKLTGMPDDFFDRHAP